MVKIVTYSRSRSRPDPPLGAPAGVREHQAVQLHPIMYVEDQYAERSFYELFGFQRVYEGDEFPGFLAIGHGEAIIGLQRASPGQPAYSHGLRWQFELDRADQVDEIIATCRTHGLEHEVTVERGGDRFLRRLVAVKSPCGVTVWFEGADEADAAGG
jgi:hypothetical protein